MERGVRCKSELFQLASILIDFGRISQAKAALVRKDER